MTRQQLTARGDVLRVLNTDDVMKVIRKVATFNYNESIKRLLDPAQRKPNETIEELRAEAAAHKVYVEMFERFEVEGKEALKKLRAEMDNGGE